jgi:hypothetical protein
MLFSASPTRQRSRGKSLQKDIRFSAGLSKKTDLYDGEALMFESRYGQFEKEDGARFNSKVAPSKSRFGVFVPEVAYVTDMNEIKHFNE